MTAVDIRTQNLAKLACAGAGLTWGLFWLPLRWLEDAGVPQQWVGAVFLGSQLVFVLPLIAWRIRKIAIGGFGLLLTVMFAGFAFGAYSAAIVYTDVIRAILLFYLTPVWSTLLARAILKEPVSPLRWVAIALAFAGLLVIFGADIGVPWPRNFGDWLGLLSGLFWAAAAVRLNIDKSSHPFEFTLGFAAFGALFCIAIALLPFDGAFPAPAADTVAGVLPWLLPIVALFVLPSTFATMWGARLIDPGLVGLLFMTEIIIGTITVAIWAGEPFGLRELTGVVLITAAGALESVWDVARRGRR